MNETKGVLLNFPFRESPSSYRNVEIKRCYETDKWEGVITRTFAVRWIGGERAGGQDGGMCVGCTVKRMHEEGRWSSLAASKKPTENLKLKINGNLTKFETLQLDILASNASETANKALAIVIRGESAVKDAQAHATEAESAAQKAAAAHKVVEGVVVSSKAVAEASHQTTATKAAELAVQFANEAELALSKARNAEQKALGNATSIATEQQYTTEQTS